MAKKICNHCGLEKTKKNSTGGICRESDPRVLEFHHVGEKAMTITRADFKVQV
jgi:hypothetical protein